MRAIHHAAGPKLLAACVLLTADEKDQLLPKYWRVPQRQIETSVVLGDRRWFDELGGPLTLYLAQWALNALWTPLFFGLQRPGLAFAEILILLLAILVTLAAFGRVKRLAGALLIPYTLWAGFATVLNYTIWRMNA